MKRLKAGWEWTVLIVGLIFVPAVRQAVSIALEEFMDAREPLADAPTLNPDWAAARAIDRRRSGEPE